MRKPYIALACMTAAVAVQAQKLSTEVEVDRTVAPVERAATRLGGLSPQLVLPTPATPQLAGADYRLLSPFKRTYTSLIPAEGSGIEPASSYRGYASLGYLPWQNAGITAGYKFCDSKKLSVSGAVQLDHANFNSRQEMAKYQDNRQTHTNGRAALDMSYRPNHESTLDGTVNYDILRQGSLLWDAQVINTFGTEWSWKSKINDIEYYARAGADFSKADDVYAAFLFDQDADGNPVGGGYRQNFYTVKAGAAKNFVGTSYAGLDISTGIQSDNKHPGRPDKPFTAVNITPYYALRPDSTGGPDVRVGLTCELENADGDTHLHLLPDVRLQWEVNPSVGIWGSLTGGTVFNTFADMRRYYPIMMFDGPLAPSFLSLKAEGGVNFGPFRGVNFGIFGGYAKAHDWQLLGAGRNSATMTVGDLRSYYGGLSADASVSILRAHVSARFAPSGLQYAWIEFMDRAACVLDARLDARITHNITAGIGYERRTSRKSYSEAGNCYELGDVNNLSLRAEWRPTPVYSAWCSFENLLCSHWDALALQSAQSVHGLIGATIKF